MIVRLFILAILYSFQQLVNVLPVGNLPDGIYTAFATTLTYLSGWDVIFPISTFLTILKIVVAFELIVWFWHGGVWVYNKIRGI